MKFIKLTSDEGFQLYLNPDNIIMFFEDETETKHTAIVLEDTSLNLVVTETVDEVAALIKKSEMDVLSAFGIEGA